MSSSTQDGHFHKFGSTYLWVPNAAYQVSRSSASWFRRFLPYTIMAAILVMWPKPLELTSIPPTHEAPIEIWLQWALPLLRKRSSKILNLSDLDQSQWMTLTFGTHKASCTHPVDFTYQLWYHRLQKFLKKKNTTFSHTKAEERKFYLAIK